MSEPIPEPPRAGDAGAPRPSPAAVVLLVVLLAGIVAAGFWIAPHVTRERVEGWVRGAGAYGPLVLMGIQVAQILVAPVPGVFVPLLAGFLYGPVVGPVVTAAGTLIGSTVAFWIGRRAGRPLAERWLGREAVEKAHSLISGKRWIALIPLFLVPLSPSDALCFMAGILAMDWGRFTVAVVLGRLPKDSLLAVGAALGWGAVFGKS